MQRRTAVLGMATASVSLISGCFNEESANGDIILYNQDQRAHLVKISILNESETVFESEAQIQSSEEKTLTDVYNTDASDIVIKLNGGIRKTHEITSGLCAIHVFIDSSEKIEIEGGYCD